MGVCVCRLGGEDEKVFSAESSKESGAIFAFALQNNCDHVCVRVCVCVYECLFTQLILLPA